LPAIEFEQRGRALESLDRERTFGKQSFKRGAVVLCQSQVIFFHHTVAGVDPDLLSLDIYTPPNAQNAPVVM
jgi:hypothetical protein